MPGEPEASAQTRPDPRGRLDEREVSRVQALHIHVGTSCQNDCLFCSDGGFGRYEPVLTDQVFRILEENRGHRQVAFVTHEPTLNPDLPAMARRAKDLGYQSICVPTNGRRLGQEKLLSALLEAGVTRFEITFHGPNAAVHEAIVQRRGAFEQTLAGIRAVVAARQRQPLELVFHSTIAAPNVGHLSEMIDFALAFEPYHYGLNTVFLLGSATQNLDRVALSYSEVLDALAKCLPSDRFLPISVSEIPLCLALDRIPRQYLGVRIDSQVHASGADDASVRSTLLSRGFLYGEPCATCAARSACDGLAPAYVERFGWGELRAVPPQKSAPAPVVFDADGVLEKRLRSGAPKLLLTGLKREERRAIVRLRLAGSPLEVELLISERSDAEPAFRQTARYNVSLKGTGHTNQQVAFAEAIVRFLRRHERGS